MLAFSCFLTSCFSKFCNYFQSITLLACRICIAEVFFKAGLVKIASYNEYWFTNEATVQLFQYEYQTPMGVILPEGIYNMLHALMPPVLAANLGAITEVVVPIFLVLGLGARFPAFILFVFNFIAATSYPFLWTPEGQIGLEQHIYWGAALGILTAFGSGKFSFDFLLSKKCNKFVY